MPLFLEFELANGKPVYINISAIASFQEYDLYEKLGESPTLTTSIGLVNGGLRVVTGTPKENAEYIEKAYESRNS